MPWIVLFHDLMDPLASHAVYRSEAGSTDHMHNEAAGFSNSKAPCSFSAFLWMSLVAQAFFQVYKTDPHLMIPLLYLMIALVFHQMARAN